MNIRAWTGCLLAVLLFFAAGPVRLHAQPARVFGTVIDAETGQPLPGVNVFVAGTTLGAATDQDGHFDMRRPAQHEFEVVASMLGYKVEAKTLRPTDLPQEGLLVRLLSITFELDAVEVVAERPRAWKRNLERFTALLFSTTSNGKKCELLNPEVLDFSFDKATEILEATAGAPLQIDNPSLGYRITIHDPSLVGREGQLRWGGKLQFEELDAPNERARKKWARNRQRVYEGSARHFLASLVAGTVVEEGFSAYYVYKPGAVSKRNPIREMGLDFQPREMPALLEDGYTEDTRTLRFFGFLYVLYIYEGESEEYVDYQNKYRLRPDRGRPAGPPMARPAQSSWLTLLTDFTLIDRKGNEYGGYALKRYGYWGWERLGEKLPYDYQPGS